MDHPLLNLFFGTSLVLLGLHFLLIITLIIFVRYYLISTNWNGSNKFLLVIRNSQFNINIWATLLIFCLIVMGYTFYYLLLNSDSLIHIINPIMDNYDHYIWIFVPLISILKIIMWLNAGKFSHISKFIMYTSYKSDPFNLLEHSVTWLLIVASFLIVLSIFLIYFIFWWINVTKSDSMLFKISTFIPFDTRVLILTTLILIIGLNWLRVGVLNMYSVLEAY